MANCKIRCLSKSEKGLRRRGRGSKGRITLSCIRSLKVTGLGKLPESKKTGKESEEENEEKGGGDI